MFDFQTAKIGTYDKMNLHHLQSEISLLKVHFKSIVIICCLTSGTMLNRDYFVYSENCGAGTPNKGLNMPYKECSKQIFYIRDGKE